jgi:hypothetical protein
MQPPSLARREAASYSHRSNFAEAGEAVMAKKARKKSAVKAKKVKRARPRNKVKTKRKAKTAARKKAVRKPRPKAQPQGIADKVASAFHTLVDTIKETGELRNKLGRPGSEP